MLLMIEQQVRAASVLSCTMLHTAAQHSRSDCIPLLLAAGVDVTALNAANEPALQLTCTYCDVETVQLLLDAGGWLTSNGFKGPLAATRAGNAEVLELLLSATTAASDSGSSDSSDSSCGQMCCMQATTATSGLKLLHIAAAVRSLSCAKLQSLCQLILTSVH
jgi:ankyrin repeat protein